MKTSDMIQLGALAVIGFLAYEQFAKANPKAPPAGAPPPLQPSKLAPTPKSFDIPQDFGFKDPNNWDDTQNVSTLSDLLGTWL